MQHTSCFLKRGCVRSKIYCYEHLNNWKIKKKNPVKFQGVKNVLTSISSSPLPWKPWLKEKIQCAAHEWNLTVRAHKAQICILSWFLKQVCVLFAIMVQICFASSTVRWYVLCFASSMCDISACVCVRADRRDTVLLPRSELNARLGSDMRADRLSLTWHQ